MAVQKCYGVKQCPQCENFIKWTENSDIKYIRGNKVIVCPECGYKVIIDDIERFLIPEEG